MHGSTETFLSLDLTWAICTAALIATQCALLSVLVVLKRMAFIGQGISHAAMGGVGIAAILGISHTSPLYFGVVGGTCVLAAVLVGWLRDRRAISSDTAIGIVLVASMALGITLIQIAQQAAEAAHDHADHADHAGHDHAHDHGLDHATGHEWESLLFGSLADVGMLDAIVAGSLLLVTIILALRFGRAILFWGFDERAARAFGAPTSAAQLGLMIALAATIVASMKLVGVILATALLVLPGACALRLSNKIAGVLIASIITALLALGAGLAASAYLAIPVGGAIVLALVLCYALTWPLARMMPASSVPATITTERTPA